jgi:hypothetical protein
MPSPLPEQHGPSLGESLIIASKYRRAACFNLAIDIGAGVAAHHLHQPPGRDLGLGRFVPAPGVDYRRVQVACSMPIFIALPATTPGWTLIRKAAGNSGKKSVQPAC